MTYSPTTWVDEVPGEDPVKFEIDDDVLGSIATSATIELASTPIAGTAYNAERFNAIEQGIAAVEAATVPEILTAKGDLVAGTLTGSAEIVSIPPWISGAYLVPASGAGSGMAWRAMMVFGDYTYNPGHLAYTETVINPETDFGISANAKMILLTVTVAWYGIWGDVYVGMPGNMSIEKAYLYLQRDAVATGYAGGAYDYLSGWVPLDADGNFSIVSIYDRPSVYLRITAYMQ